MDVTSKTEGKAFADATGVPLLVKYDTRLRDNVAKGIVADVTEGVQVGFNSPFGRNRGLCRALIMA